MPPKKKLKASLLTDEYVQTLLELKEQVQHAQTNAILLANKELIKLYWNIGKLITEKQQRCGWGDKLIERFAKDLQDAFPGVEGFSVRNLFRMKAFYRAYEIMPQAVAQFEGLPIFDIPWGHNAVILEKLKDINKRLWYAQKAIEYGWSRSMLDTWIKSDLYSREGKAITNFKKTMLKPQSDMAQQTLKDPYIFDFLTLHKEHAEKEVEQGLIDHIQSFLVEVGQGFAFVGRQYHLAVGEKDYYVDLLFYHLRLKCYVVVELKSREFDPRGAGQLNFYLSAVDDMLCSKGDKPTIGLLLCQSKDNFTAEYALRDINKPIGVASYETKLIESLPKNLKGSLPTISEIEAEIQKKSKIQKILKKRATCL